MDKKGEEMEQELIACEKKVEEKEKKHEWRINCKGHKGEYFQMKKGRKTKNNKNDIKRERKK